MAKKKSTKKKVVATEPVATEPVATEPVATEPVATEPVATEPVATEPVARAGKVKLIKMVKEVPECSDDPTSCDVHPNEVSNYAAGGWTKA